MLLPNVFPGEQSFPTFANPSPAGLSEAIFSVGAREDRELPLREKDDQKEIKKDERQPAIHSHNYATAFPQSRRSNSSLMKDNHV